jgi:uncharacterized membrane protein YphA (DoxX/SURF4 family)
MNIALWLLQGLLAALFLAAGSMKIFAYEKYKAQAGEGATSKNFTAFIGISEIAGAIGLVVPWATGALPVLTPIAAGALGVVMVLAAVHHAQRRDPVAKMVPALALLVMSGVVAWGRA